jgi:predicted methyltransferase
MMSPRVTRRRLLATAPLGTLLRPDAALAGAEDARLAAAIASPTRAAANVARDRYRHPAAALAFFGLRDFDTVLEVEPGAGYWSEILAPYLAERGQYQVAIPAAPATEPRLAAAERKYLLKLQADPAAASASRTIAAWPAHPRTRAPKAATCGRIMRSP